MKPLRLPLILSLLFFSTLIAQATLPPLTVPPPGGYDSGSNSILDPGCAPNTLNCWVNLPIGGSVTANNGLTATGSNVQLGGTLVQNTAIDQAGYNFEQKNISNVDFFGTPLPTTLSYINGTTSYFGTGSSQYLEGFSGTMDFSPLIGSPAAINAFIGLVPNISDDLLAPTLIKSDGATLQSIILGKDGPVLKSEDLSGGRYSTISMGEDNVSLGASGGISFFFPGGDYTFPDTDGLANQVLTTDGSGQLSWQNGGGSLKWYAENSTAPAVAPVATGIGSIALGNGAMATADNMFVYGKSAGSSAISATNSNFIGEYAGYKATNASNSNFFGTNAGYQASGANDSIFFGTNAGYQASGANDSIFIGTNAGANAITAGKSIFIGINAGFNDTLNSTNGGSILIGSQTSTGGYYNTIALGAGATNTAINQLMIGSMSSPINETRFQGSVIGTQCTITTGTGIACTSDERLKENITDLSSTILEDLMNIKTVHYNLISDTTHKPQIGFLAQNLEQYFPELVDTDHNSGYKSVYYAQMTPILVEAVKELNLKLTTLELANGTTPTNIFDSLKNWLGNLENGITDIYAKVFHADRVETKELCVGQTCLNETQVQQLLQVIGSSATVSSPGGSSIGTDSSQPVTITGGDTGSPTTPDPAVGTPTLPDTSITTGSNN